MRKSGRTPLYPEEEGDVLEMIVEQREKGVPLSWKIIMQWMKELTMDDPGFKASWGWIHRFANRHALTLRKPTKKVKVIAPVANGPTYEEKMRQVTRVGWI